MEGFKEEADVRFIKMSVISVRQPENGTPPTPGDKYNIVYMLFFFFGLGGVLPNVYFMTATDYWMYKFRDPTQENYDSHKRNQLQANFMGISATIHSVPGLVTTMILTRYGHKIHIRIRILVSLIAIVVIYILFTAFVVVNTDSWQLAFFVLTLVVSTSICVLQIIFQFSNLALISRFPNEYLKSQMYGTSSSGIISAVIQIICLAIGETPTESALIYFSTGTFILTVTLILAYVSKNLPFFQYYLGDAVADVKKPVHTLTEMKEVTIRIWPLIGMMFVAIATMCISHSNITNLVVSECYGENQWCDKLFVPTITFLLADIMALTGRFFAKPIFTPNNAKWFAAFDVTRTILMTPLCLFCNALPRRHLPVLFPHDWEYIFLLGSIQLMRAFFSTCSALSMRNLIGDQAELGFLIMQTLGGFTGSIFSLLNPVIVNKL
ncbi:equilibrative nucleoside transporter 3 isoform X1 [Leptinotarsa decemlineata]|uniref:equilibrative nucleoside transporter 3 isoform X1 n=2 Tax=Leptinotarsa decemlineata TaxID=7539 RepID=UPI003D308263